MSLHNLSRRQFLTSAAASASVAAISGTMACSRDQRNQKPRNTGPIIDTHMHVWANDPKRYPFPHPYQANFRFADVPHEATVEMLNADMDKNGCTHAVLVQVIYHGWDNSYVADCVKRFPKRFKAHGLIDPTDENVAKKLEFWVKEHGLHGMRFSPIYYENGKLGGDAWLDADRTHQVWRVAEKLGAVFNFFVSPYQLPKLARMVKAHPKVKITLDHLSQTDLGKAPEPQMKLLLSMAKYPNVFVKVSELSSVSKSKTYPFPDAYPYVERVLDAFGPDRLLFGTGYPGKARAAYKRPTLRDEIALIHKMPFFSDSDRAKLLGVNAKRVWGFED